MRELIIKKCLKCGAVVKVIEEYGNLQCCGQDMVRVMPNSVDAAFEKHIPTYEVDGDEIVAKVNHVMDVDHYIEWIALVTEKTEEFIDFIPGDSTEVRFKYVPGSTLYAYCNKHGLWKADVK